MKNTVTLRRRFLLAGTAITAVITSSSVAAQQAQDEEAAGLNAANVIIVTGSIRQSQEAAIAAKRAAPNLVDVASSDSVGRFPDESIAAALTRLPGVAVQLDQGQARYVQVRGAPNRWTSVSIDGIPQTGTDEANEGRAYRFDAVPAVLLSELRINKSLTPDLTAEAISANIDLRTYSALNSSGFTVSGDVGYGFMELGDGDQRQGSLRAAYGGDNWGIVLGGSHYTRAQVTDNREFDYSIGTDGELAPTDIDVRSYKLDRTTNGLFGALEFEPSENQTFYLRGIFTEFKDDEQRTAYQFELDEAASGTRTAAGGDLVGVPVDGAFNDAKYRSRNYVFSTGVTLDYNDWGGEFALGYTKTDNSTDLPLTLTTTRGANNVSLTYDRTDPNFPIITGLFRTAFDIDPETETQINPRRGGAITKFDQSSFNGFTFVLPIINATTSDAYTAKVDLWKEYGDFTVRVGALGQQRDIVGSSFNTGGIVPLQPLGFNVNDYVTDEPWDTNFPLGVPFTYADNERLDADQKALFAANDIVLTDLLSEQDFFDQKEKIYAGYLMGEYETGDLFVTAGARAEFYEVQSAGIAVVGTVETPIDVTQDFFDIFPSLNLRYNVSDDFVLRVAGQRGVSRPAYAAIRAGNTISDEGESISGGNPTLRPEYTWGIDASAEYYLPGNGIISVAAFKRWVDDVLYDSTQILGSDAFNSGGIDRSNYRLNSTFNGISGSVTGIEFNVQHQFEYLPGPLAGFGVQGNLTFLDGDFDALDEAGDRFTAAFPGLSDTLVNASLFYELYGLSARVSYQWRSEFTSTVNIGVGEGTLRGAFENLDVTLRYALTDNFTVFADLANLTDEIYTVFEGTPDFPSEVEQIGSRYLIGFRFDF